MTPSEQMKSALSLAGERHDGHELHNEIDQDIDNGRRDS
jgi:hypothetical protein